MINQKLVSLHTWTKLQSYYLNFQNSWVIWIHCNYWNYNQSIFPTGFTSQVGLNKDATFVQLGFNLSNGETDTLESSSILIQLIQVKGIYTQKVTLFKTRNLIKQNIKESIMAKLMKQVFNLRGGTSNVWISFTNSESQILRLTPNYLIAKMRVLHLKNKTHPRLGILKTFLNHFCLLHESL